MLLGILPREQTHLWGTNSNLGDILIHNVQKDLIADLRSKK